MALKGPDALSAGDLPQLYVEVLGAGGYYVVVYGAETEDYVLVVGPYFIGELEL